MSVTPSSPTDLPLEGVRVLDFAQFLAGPYAAMRLADLGADVIKVERPQGGDLCRSLAVNDQWLDGDSLLFHSINRNKRSFAANLKDAGDLKSVKALIASADVMIHNFRPGVMERIGLGYDVVSELNPRLVYASVTGYGTTGPWRDKPGQDLLAQSLSGITWLQGNDADGPVPVGFALYDIATALNLVQGILACLLRRGRTGKGGLIEVDLLSSGMDLQFEQLTCFFNGERTQPRRTEISNANVYGAAPYGIYATKDGHLAVAMTPLKRLAELFALPALGAFDQSDALKRANEIKPLLQARISERTTAEWLAILEPADVWCAEVLDWPRLAESEGFAELDMLQTVRNGAGSEMKMVQCPMRLDGSRLPSPLGAPALGADSDTLLNELGLA
ncbi:CoA transferase [Tropicimonas sp. TH_r6]|uniref:CaiB/BaiF CoA transferase family protein n=1 Tax=Tropicimonas sp. TH_r6 TaxID=3082085 RepID=UPI00295562B5|nr:CoA transferase [Tropicimonas sp. TH_r6]MDV7145600.1 CoA transferase [Tropicimonas sp. TH_r6]